MGSAKPTLVPFFGAGASLAARSTLGKARSSPSPAAHSVAAGLASLSAPEVAKLVEALLFEGSSELGPDTPAVPSGPPSSSQLAHALAADVGYEPFRPTATRIVERLGLSPAVKHDLQRAIGRLSEALDIGNPPVSLPSLAGYVATRYNRKRVWDVLQTLLPPTLSPGLPQRVVAAAASASLAAGAQSFLIITTNYDNLIERAVEALKLPYVVLTVPSSSMNVVFRCSPGLEIGHSAGLSNKIPARSFLIESASAPFVLIYKMHGCVSDPFSEATDAVVISEDDYVDILSGESCNGALIPVQITTSITNNQILFVGYRLADWNVRSMMMRVRDKRGPRADFRDYLVAPRAGAIDKSYYDKLGLTVCQDDANAFFAEVARFVPMPNVEVAS